MISLILYAGYEIYISSPKRLFSTSSPRWANRSHRLFQLVNWDRVANGMFAVVDPIDPTGILYLSEDEYKIQVRVTQSNRGSLTVLARPGDTKDIQVSDSSTNPSSKSENSPPGMGWFSGFGKLRQAVRSLNLRWAFASPILGNHEVKRNGQTGSLEVPLRLLSWLLWTFAKLLMFKGGSSYRQAASREEVLIFAKALAHIGTTRGIGSAIRAMKVAFIVVTNFVGGGTAPNTRELGEGISLRGARKLPKLLPITVRNRIARRHPTTLKVWLSLLYVYKALQGTYAPISVNSITDPPQPARAGWAEGLTSFVADHLIPYWEKHLRIRVNPFMTPPKKVTPMYTAGPNGSVAFRAAPWDALAWVVSGDLKVFALFCEVFGFTGIYESLLYTAEDCRQWWKKFPKTIDVSDWIENRAKLGKLATKHEAAGKIRVFAIVDIWTQTVLRPIHSWMFSVLRKLEADGTFNQEAAVESFAKKGLKQIFSYDLKNATDRIPKIVYMCIFGQLLTPEKAEAWWNLLVDRDYHLPKEAAKDTGKPSVRYATGQPMGALSSWPAMAIAHHILVLWSAWRAGKGLSFTNYRVLGDDVVIGDPDVAREYLETMDAFAVPVSLPKSYISDRGLFSFASRIFFGALDLSPISIRDEAVITTFPQRLQSLVSTLGRGLFPKVSVPTLLRSILPRKAYLAARDAAQDKGLQLLLPFAAMVVSLILVPSVSVYAALGLPVSDCKPFLAVLSGKRSLWSTPIHVLPQLVSDQLAELFNKVLIRRLASEWLRKESQMLPRWKALPDWLEEMKEINRPFVKLVSELTVGRDRLWEPWDPKVELSLVSSQNTLRSEGVSDVDFWMTQNKHLRLRSTMDLLTIAKEAIGYFPPFQYQEAFSCAAAEVVDNDQSLLDLADLVDFFYIASMEEAVSRVPDSFTEYPEFNLSGVRAGAYGLPDIARPKRRKPAQLTEITLLSRAVSV